MDQLDRLKLPLAPAGAVAEFARLMSKPKVSRTVVSVLMYLTAVAFPLAAQSPTPDPKDVEKIRAQAEAGDAKSEFQLAIYIINSRAAEQPNGLTEQDWTEVVKWYRKAAEKNFAPAQRNLAGLYGSGFGVPLNQVEACKWYRKAAEQNDPFAQSALGGCYFQGEALPKDMVEACKWFRKAAEQNLVGAQTSLGQRYFFGEGVPKDDVQAYKWFTLAAAQGSGDAKTYLGALEKKLTAAQKAEGEKLVRGFKPVTPSPRPESSAGTTPTPSP
jgi:TPR repeat protein